MKKLILFALLALIGSCQPVQEQSERINKQDPTGIPADVPGEYDIPGGQVGFECHNCTLVDDQNCDVCRGTGSKLYAQGILVKYSNKAPDFVRSPFDVWVRGSSVVLEDYRGQTVSFSLSQTIYNNIPELLQVLSDCNCGAAGGGGADGVVSSGTFNSGTGVLTLNRTVGGNVTVSGFPTTSGGGGSNVTNVTFTNGVLNVTTDEPNTFNVNIDASTIELTGPITVGSTNYAAGTDIETVLNAINSELHDPATLTNNAAPFSWNTATQTGNIPTTSVTQNGDTITIDPGDGTGGITFVNNNAGAAQSISYYDSGQGFWVYATPGVVTTSPTLGNYTITIPVGGTIISFSKNFSNAATELTAGGEVQITVDHNTAAFNTSFTDAILPVITLMPSALSNQQYPPQSTGFTQPHGVSLFNNSVSAGATVQTITNVNGMVGSGNSMVVKGKF